MKACISNFKNTLIGEEIHLSHSGESYISYENYNSKTDDGKSLPNKKPFVDPKLDYENRTFTGTLHWNGNSTVWGGVMRDDFNLTFSKDWRTLESGVSFYTYKNSSNNREYKYRKSYFTRFDNAWDYISDGQKFL